MQEKQSDFMGKINEVEGAVLPYVVFKLQDSKYALSSKYVLHIEVLGDVTPMVDMEPNCRGIIIFNDASISVYDMRSMFGIGNYAEELEEFMQQCITNNENWVKALEDSVESGEEFELNTDPHACSFGVWFDNFKSDNSHFNMYIKGVDEPHKAIYKTGDLVKSLMRKDKKEEALAVIAKMKATDFVKTRDILSSASKMYIEGSREMQIVLQIGEKTMAIIVDRITDIKELNEMCAVQKNMVGSRYVERIARDKQPDGDIDLIQIISVKEL